MSARYVVQLGRAHADDVGAPATNGTWTSLDGDQLPEELQGCYEGPVEGGEFALRADAERACAALMAVRGPGESFRVFTLLPF